MADLVIGDLATRHAQWLMARQQTIASNVAHASSPGYRAMDVKSFADSLERTGLAMASTSPSHLAISATEAVPVGRKPARVVDVSHTGNTVSLDQQLMMATEVRQGYALNTSVVKSFNRMLLAAVKG